MGNVLNHPQAYIPGQLKIGRTSDRLFYLIGNYCVPDNIGTDHQQLIYEALEIAAHSTDKFAPQFRAMCDEYLELTKDWAD